MKVIITILSLAISVPSLAQSDSYWFEAGNEKHYVAKGCEPLSQVQWYSQAGGGKIIKQTSTDQDGSLKYIAASSFTPAFILQNNQVTHWENPEFKIKKWEIEKAPNQSATISFYASANNVNNTFFEILKSEDGHTWTVIHALQATALQMQRYQFTDLGEAKPAFYKINVVNQEWQTRYSSPALNTISVASSLIYPTAAQNNLNLCLAAEDVSCQYQIISMTGSVIVTGASKGLVSTIDISAFAPGAYFIKIINGDNAIDTYKFIKL